MKEARERAIAFVAACGDGAALASARALCGQSSAAEALAALEPPSSLADAVSVLGRAGDLRGLGTAQAERTVAWVEERQSGDGSWEGDLFATGMLAGQLGKTPYARPATLDAAGAWLEARWDPERVKGGAWEAIAAFATFFGNVPHELSDPALQWCGRELERGYRSGIFDPVATARVLLWCDAHAIPGARLGAAELLEAILAAQKPDGGWGSHSPAARVALTLDALVALSRWS